MKVGDLVIPNRYDSHVEGTGLITDSFYNDSDLHEYFYVKWSHDFEWWSELELKVINEHS